MDIAKFKKLPVMGILRGTEERQLEPILEASIAGGLQTLEITMNTPDAQNLIKKAAKFSKNRLAIGAGTVLSIDSMKTALKAGATFIVMPTLVRDVAQHCVKNHIPVFPGALTPQEVYNAYCAGATMVKVFPAKVFGPEYFKELKGPFDNIELLACGGVTTQNLKTYMVCGASAVAFGNSVFKTEWLAKNDFKSITESIKKFTRYFRN